MIKKVFKGRESYEALRFNGQNIIDLWDFFGDYQFDQKHDLVPQLHRPHIRGRYEKNLAVGEWAVKNKHGHIKFFSHRKFTAHFGSRKQPWWSSIWRRLARPGRR